MVRSFRDLWTMLPLAPLHECLSKASFANLGYESHKIHPRPPESVWFPNNKKDQISSPFSMLALL
jgi:hypothetical protein